MKDQFKSYLTITNIFKFSAVNYAQSGLGFLISILLARFLSKTDFGLYTMGLVFMNSVLVLSSFGMDRSLVRDVVQSRSSGQSIILYSSIFKGLFGFVIFGLLLIWAIWWERMEMIKVLVIVLCGFAGLLLALSPRAWYDVTGRIQYHAYLTLGERIFFTLAVAVLLIWFRDVSNIIVILLALLAISKLIFTMLEWKIVWKDFLKVPNLFRQNFMLILKSNSWLWLAALGNLMMVQCNQLILESSYGLKQLATFGLAFQLIQFIRMLQSQILRLASPKIARISTVEPRTIVYSLINLCALALFATLILVIPFYYLAPRLVTSLVGTDFLDAIPVFNVLLIWVLIYGVAIINNQFLISLHLQRQYFVTTLIFGILSLGLAIFFVQKFGAIGAAYSLVIAHAGSVFTQMIIVGQHIGLFRQVLNGHSIKED